MVELSTISRLHLCLNVLRDVPSMLVEGANLVVLAPGCSPSTKSTSGSNSTTCRRSRLGLVEVTGRATPGPLSAVLAQDPAASLDELDHVAVWVLHEHGANTEAQIIVGGRDDASLILQRGQKRL